MCAMLYVFGCFWSTNEEWKLGNFGLLFALTSEKSDNPEGSDTTNHIFKIVDQFICLPTT